MINFCIDYHDKYLKIDKDKLLQSYDKIYETYKEVLQTAQLDNANDLDEIEKEFVNVAF